MNLVKVQDTTLYLRKRDDGKYETVNPYLRPLGEILYSLEITEFEEDGRTPKGKYFHIPQTVSVEDIAAFRASVYSQSPVTGTPSGTSRFIIDGHSVDVDFPPTTILTDITNAINNACASEIGSAYSNVATIEGNRIRIVSPSPQNSYIVIERASIFDIHLHFISGEHPGDLPFAYRSYIEDEKYILVRETVTPNKGVPSGRFYPSVEKNNMLFYSSSFDKRLIDDNPRLKVLMDSFAFVMQRLDDEISRYVDQLDISKIDTKNLEYLAYLFGIDLQRLTTANGAVSARETLRSLMHIIHVKGTEESFKLFMKFIGFDSSVKEYYSDLVPVDVDVTQAVIDAYYDRFLKKDSTFRNPVLSYGSFVVTYADLPVSGYEGEIIKVLPPDPNSGIYRWNEATSTWDKLYTSLTPVYGLGTEVDSELNLDFRFQSVDQPYNLIHVSDYNDLRLLTGFEVQPGGVRGYDENLWTYDDTVIPYRAQIISENAGPWDMSNLDDRVLNLLVNSSVEYSIDFENFQNQISDFSAVTFLEVKTIIENNFTELVCLEAPGGYLIIRSRECGNSSEIKTLPGDNPTTGNAALGYALTASHKIFQQSIYLRVKAGTANPSEDTIAIPQVTTVDTDIHIVNESGGPLLSGYYYLFVHKNGSILVLSQNKFQGATFIPDLGWLSQDVSITDAKMVATIQARDGQIVRITESPSQDDYIPYTTWTEEQELALRAFIHSKTNVANRTGPSYTITEDVLPTPQPLYLRTSERNPAQPQEPGYSNKITLDVFPIEDDFILTQEIITQTIDFINYVRPVHIRLLEVAFNVPEIMDHWPIVQDRTGDNDYMPGFWDGSQSVIPQAATFTASLTGVETFTLPFTPIYGPLGQLATTLTVVVYVNGVLTPATAVNATLGQVSVPVTVGDFVVINYHLSDGKFPFELDIKDDLEVGIGLYSSYFTNGDVYKDSTPSSGENEQLEYSYAATQSGYRQVRNNALLKSQTVTNTSTEIGNAWYDNIWQTYRLLKIEQNDVSTTSNNTFIWNSYVNGTFGGPGHLAIGSQVTQQTSGATGVVIFRNQVGPGADTILIRSLTGTFDDTNVIETVNPTPPWLPPMLSFTPSGVPADLTTYIPPTSTGNRAIIRLDAADIAGNNPAVGGTITFTKTGVGTTFASTVAATTTYTFIAGPAVAPNVQIGATPSVTLQNLTAAINAYDGVDLTATYINDSEGIRVEVVDDTTNGFSTPAPTDSLLDSLLNPLPWAVYSEYYALKKPMVTDVLTKVGIQDVFESQFTGMGENFMENWGRLNISNMIWQQGIVTVVTGTPHRLRTGQLVRIGQYKTTPPVSETSGYLGIFEIIVSGINSFQFRLAANPGTWVGNEYIYTNSPQLPYYNSSHYLHRGHTHQAKDLASIAAETNYLTDFVFRGISNGAIGGDWETMTGTLSDARLGTPYFHGSERYDGGGKAGSVGDIDMTDLYTDYIEPTGNRHFRNMGMHNSEPVVVTVQYGARFNISVPSGPFTVGETVTGFTSGATAVVVSDNGTYLIVKGFSATPFVLTETITGSLSTNTATLDKVEGNNADLTTSTGIFIRGLDAVTGNTLATLVADTSANHRIVICS